MLKFLMISLTLSSADQIWALPLNDLQLTCKVGGPLWTSFNEIRLNKNANKCILSSLYQGKTLKVKNLSEKKCNTTIKKYSRFITSKHLVPRRINPKVTHLKVTWNYAGHKQSSMAQFPGHMICDVKGKCKSPRLSTSAKLCTSLMKLLGY